MDCNEWHKGVFHKAWLEILLDRDMRLPKAAEKLFFSHKQE